MTRNTGSTVKYEVATLVASSREIHVDTFYDPASVREMLPAILATREPDTSVLITRITVDDVTQEFMP